MTKAAPLRQRKGSEKPKLFFRRLNGFQNRFSLKIHQKSLKKGVGFDIIIKICSNPDG